MFESKVSEAKISQKSPILENLETGKSYFWCACGRSKNQLFCDGSYTDTVFLPLKYKAYKSEKIFFIVVTKRATRHSVMERIKISSQKNE
jgi:CDGSH-type Zn-finger protein